MHIFAHKTLSSYIYVQVVCDRKEAYALGSAVSRAFPRYLRSSSVTVEVVKVIQVGFVFVGENTQPLTDGEVVCLKETCEGVCVCVCVCVRLYVYLYMTNVAL